MVKNILIADDHEIVRSGVEMIINNIGGIYNFLEAATCKEVRKLLATHSLDYMVLDLFLADGNTFTIIEQIAAEYPGISILVYTMSAERIYAKRLLQKGVQGFVCKQAGIADLESVLRKFLNGEKYISLSSEKYLSDNSEFKENPIDALSDRELEVVEYLTLGMGIKEIAAQMDVNTTTISTFRKRALAKLKVENNIELKELFLLYKMELA